MTSQTALKARSDADRMIPRAMLRATFGLAAFALALTTYARLADLPLVATPPASPVIAERSLVLDSDISGAVTVTLADGQSRVFSPEEGGFIAGVHRVIVFEREKHRLPAEGPVTVTLARNGRIAIHDPSTGWSADLMGFGADNARAFARLLQD